MAKKASRKKPSPDPLRRDRPDVQEALAQLPPVGQVTRFEKFKSSEVHRSQLKNAPYNPRVITEKARARLKKNIQKVGLVEPPVWNRRTGNIVGGHQRVSVLDLLEGTQDYKLTVSEVDLDEKTEKEQNVFLNNGEAQGGWDLEKLGALYKDDKLDFEATGFDTADIYQMFGDTPLIDRPEELAAVADRVRAARDAYDQTVGKMSDRDDIHFYLVVVFQSHADRLLLTEAMGLPDNRFVDGRWLAEKLKQSGAAPLGLRLGSGDQPADPPSAPSLAEAKP